LAPDDKVVSMDTIDPNAFLLVATTNGFGKLTRISDYPRQHRAGRGVRTFKVIEKTGGLVAARLVTQSQQLMIISAEGIVTRIPLKEKDPRQGIPVQRRSTQGVRLMRLESGDKVVAITALD